MFPPLLTDFFPQTGGLNFRIMFLFCILFLTLEKKTAIFISVLPLIRRRYAFYLLFPLFLLLFISFIIKNFVFHIIHKIKRKEKKRNELLHCCRLKRGRFIMLVSAPCGFGILKMSIA